MTSSDQVTLTQFIKHTPRILRRQLILQLVEQYCGVSKNPGPTAPLYQGCLPCKPSIQRFHAALLFVDISGFTALSLRLNVEDLKNHINNYFTLMLGIVDKHGGDVIKFAGDALFIIWETDQTSALSEENHNVHLDVAKQKALRKAVECGKEINAACGNHKIVIPGQSSTVSRVIRTMFGSQEKKPTVLDPIATSESEEASVAFLNVHSGVSWGLMAGIDIGSDNRWEYFLIGEPLSKVAEAESQASTGDMIICPESHTILHGKEEPIPLFKRFGSAFSSRFNLLGRVATPPTSETGVAVPPPVKPLKCGCIPLKGGYCKVDMTLPPEKVNRKSRHKNNKQAPDQDLASEALVDTLKADIDDAFLTFKAMFSERIDRAAKRTKPAPLITNDGGGGGATSECTPAEQVRESFKAWALTCLSDEVARHVHAAVRHEYVFDAPKRASLLQQDSDKVKHSPRLSSLAVPPTPKSAHSLHTDSPRNSQHGSESSFRVGPGSSANLTSGTTSVSGSRPASLSPIAAPRRESHVSKQHTPNDKPREAAGLTTEIRSVTVMFVKIDLADMQLMIDETKRRRMGGGYRFLAKTVNEKFADLMLLDRLQSCMEALQQSFSSHGGQMRQFIVDDKGTVCIGTLGLRGSMSDDNAAAALNTAQMIINKLKVVGLSCSIGVTVGRAYCGLVGSGTRHEYAVMGPSTNLSARLMCKAPPGGVICDVETRIRDRTHQFVTLADIVAKGYKLPVGTFKPVFESEGGAGGGPGGFLGALVRERSEFVLNTENREDDSSKAASSATAPTESNDVILRILQSKFFVERSMGNRTVKVELHGRRGLLRQAVAFAFQACVLDTPGDKSPKGTPPPVFTHLLPARFIGIVGAQGIGKTSFVLSITQRIFSVAASNAAMYNIQLFKSRVIAAGAQPFNAWKPIISEMLIRIHRISLPAVQQTAHMGRRRSMVAGVSAAGGGSDIRAGITFAVEQFPKHLQKYAPLFSFIGIVESDGGEPLKLSEYEKIMHSTQLLLQVIQLYLRVTKNLVFITLEDIHLFDQHSLALLYEVYHSVNGVIVLFTGRLQTTTVHMDCSDSSNLLNGFTSLLDDPRKYLEVQLDALSKPATTSLVRDVFTVHNVTDVHETVYSTVYEVSRGNPFYVFEIANSMADSKDRSVKAVNAVHCIRIEEVICYRFDQLSNTAQTVLKIAAVAFSNGSAFSLDLLASISFDSEAASASSSQGRMMTQAMSRSNIATQLLDIVSSESFIRVIKRVGAAEVDISTLTLDLLLSGDYLFEFSISLEQSTLYGLLLDDQKQVIHERVAEYYSAQREALQLEEQQEGRHPLCFVEEAFHWNRASFPGNAMMCYYKAAEAEQDEVKRAELLTMAYNMFSLLREDAGVVLPARRSELRLTDVRLAVESSFAGVGETHQTGGPASPLVASAANPVLLLEQVHEIFEGSNHLLRVGMHTHIRLAQSSLSLMDDPAANAHVLEDALQMVLLVRNPVLMDSSYLSAMMQTMHGRDSNLPKNWSWSLRRSDDNADEQRGGGSPAKDDVHFYLPDFSEFLFPVLSAYLQNHLQRLPVCSEAQAKALYLSEKYLELARSEGRGEHLVQSLIQGVLISCNAGDVTRAVALFEELVSKYSPVAHSASLLSIYGSDQASLACSVMALHSVKPSGADSLSSTSFEWYSGLGHHLPSLAACFPAVVASLSLTGRHSDALSALIRYDSLMKQRVMENSSACYFMQKAVDVMNEWLAARVRLSQLMGGTETAAAAPSNGVNDEAKETSDKRLGGEIDQIIFSRGVVLPPEQSPTGFGPLARYGLDLRGLLAELSGLRCLEVWAMTARPDGESITLKYLEGLCSYGVPVLVQSSDSQTHEMNLNKHRVLSCVSELWTAVSKREGSEDSSAVVADKIMSQMRSSFSRDLLDVVRAEAEKWGASHVMESVEGLSRRMHREGETVRQ